MNTLTAAELKRRGMAAVEEGLRRGPVHLVKRNKPTAVIISADDYARMSMGAQGKVVGLTAVQWLLTRVARGTKRKRQLDEERKKERSAWE